MVWTVRYTVPGPAERERDEKASAASQVGTRRSIEVPFVLK